MKDGFITQVLVNIAFFGGLFFGGWAFPYLLPIHNQTLLAVINGNLVLLFAIGLAIMAFNLGRRLHLSFSKSWLHQLETGLSVIFSICSGLIAAWLIASMIGRLPFEGLSNSANDALIVQFLDQHLPPIPAVFAEFDRQLNPNSSHVVFIRTPFQTQQYVPIGSPTLDNVAAAAQYSAVRITSFGCGGIVSGSGFVAAPDLVLTNAHVIAGVHRPIVKYGTQSYAGIPVLYDSNTDLAALRLTGLKAKPLTLFNGHVAPDTTTVLLGYPGGNYTPSLAVVLSETQLLTANLYGVGTVDRQIYELKAVIDPGSSGGPMLLPNGQVAGVIFAKPNGTGNYAYALSSTSIRSEVQQAKQATRRVSTGTCLSSVNN